MRRRIAALLVIVMAGLTGPVSPASATSEDFYRDTHLSADLYWGFEEGSGTTHDYSGNGNAGTVSVTDPQRLQAGIDNAEGNTAFKFNGAGTVTAPDYFTRSNTFTQMAWIKTTSTTGGFIMGITASSGEHDRMMWMSNAGHLYAGLCPGPCYNTLKSPNAYNDGNWHLITQTMGPAGWRLYVDSFEVAADLDSTAGEPYTGNRTLSVGGFWNFNNANVAWGNADDPTSSRYFNGSIDEVVYFHTEQKSAAEIRTLYNEAISQVNNTQVQGTVAPTLTFSVAGKSTACNGQTPTVTATPSTVAFSSVSSAAQVIGAQDLTVQSNAANGWSLFTRATGPMTDNQGHTIANVSGDNVEPGAFPATGSEGFGYTTSDITLDGGTDNRFFNGSAAWASPSTSNELIGDEAAPTSSTVCVAYRLGVASTTPAGVYSTQVTYTVVPRF